MAKVKSPISINGSLGEFVFYQLNGKDVCRRKNPNQSKDFKTSDAYKNVRKCSTLFKACNAMATAIYRAAKQHGMRIDYLKHGKLIQQIYARYYTTPEALPELMKYSELQRTLSGFSFVKESRAISVPFLSDIHPQRIDIELKNEIKKAKLILAKGNSAVKEKDGYMISNDFDWVEVVEIEESISIETDERSFVLLVIEQDENRKMDDKMIEGVWVV